jgi:hypothetical protein
MQIDVTKMLNPKSASMISRSEKDVCPPGSLTLSRLVGIY